MALAKLHESDATLAAVAEELGQYGSQARGARGEADRLTQAIEEAEAARAEATWPGSPTSRPGSPAPRTHPTRSPTPATASAWSTARARRAQGEMDARLALRTSEERARALHGRADSLLRAAQAEREARARAAERRERLIREGRAAEAVASPPAVVLARLEVSILARPPRPAPRSSRPASGREQELLEVRARLRELNKEHDELVNSVHRDEMARTQQRMRIDQLEERALEELGLDAEGLMADYGPHQLVPATSEDEDGTLPEPVPFVREEQQKRLRTAERSLAMLGRVNPLALEEFSAMEERHKFLTEQLEDLKRTRRDLLDIVREVDAARRAGLHRGLRRRRDGLRARPSRACSPAARAAWC